MCCVSVCAWFWSVIFLLTLTDLAIFFWICSSETYGNSMKSMNAFLQRKRFVFFCQFSAKDHFELCLWHRVGLEPQRSRFRSGPHPCELAHAWLFPWSKLLPAPSAGWAFPVELLKAVALWLSYLNARVSILTSPTAQALGFVSHLPQWWLMKTWL